MQIQRCAKTLPFLINFWEYNNDCEQVANWHDFISKVEEHEREHFQQAETVLMQAGKNIYLIAESLVGGSEDELADLADDAYWSVQNPAKTAGKAEPTGNWAGTVWFWHPSPIDGLFLSRSTSF